MPALRPDAVILLAILLPFALALLAAYMILQLTAWLLRIVFAPVVWLSHRPTKQRIALYHYDVVSRGRRRSH
jgi:hypothetical protein